MEYKDQYFRALKASNGRINALELGEQMGLNEDETRAVLAQLLSEHKIEYVENSICNYVPKRLQKRKSKKS